MAGYLISDLYVHRLQDLHFISQPALPETSGWLVLELMPTRAVWKCATMEHGELCVMISGELWMQVWPANNWVSLETVSVYYCCFTITAIKSFVWKSITGFKTIWKCVISSQSIYYFTDAVAYSRAFYGQGTGSIWLDNVQCTGTESRLFDCPASAVGSHNCGHSEDAGATCQVQCKWFAQ